MYSIMRMLLPLHGANKHRNCQYVCRVATAIPQNHGYKYAAVMRSPRSFRPSLLVPMCRICAVYFILGRNFTTYVVVYFSNNQHT